METQGFTSKTGNSRKCKDWQKGRNCHSLGHFAETCFLRKQWAFTKKKKERKKEEIPTHTKNYKVQH